MSLIEIKKIIYQKMEANKSKLLFNFIGKNNIFAEYKIFGNIHNFNKTEITIPDGFFGKNKEKRILEFTLIPKNNTVNKELIFYLYVYFGTNKLYCFLESKSELLYDICFLDKKIIVNYENLELKEINTLENDSRSRIVLINSPYKLKVNNLNLDLKLIYLPSELYELNNNSFQIAFFDFFHKAYSVKPINKEEVDNELLIVKILKENKVILINFLEKLKNLIKKEETNEENYSKLCKELSLRKKVINFSQKKEVLEKSFNNEEIYYLIYIYMLWLIYDAIFSPEDDINNDNDNNNKDLFYNNDKKENYNKNSDNNSNNSGSNDVICNYSILEVFEYITNFYEKYKSDKELLNYQKVLLFWSHAVFFIKTNDMNEYNNSKLEYINIKNIENNSVFGLCFQFLNDFIFNLNNKSEIFYPLLLLDSGLYYRGDIPTYGFDFQSCDNIKYHLKDLIPDVFFVFEKKDLLQEEKGFTYKGFKIIFLNKLVVLNNYKVDPIKNDDNTKEVKHYASRTAKFFMHETFGHIKFIYQNEIGPSSPRHFYNKDKHFITMEPKNGKNKNNSNYFVINQRYLGGESGNFLDYFFGIYEDELILNLIYLTEDIGKLIDNVKYFTNENLNILKKYIIYKYIMSKNGIKFEERDNKSLEDDIKEIEKIFEIKGIKITENKSSKEPNIGEAKKDEYQGKLFFNANESEIKNYSYYVKKIEESKTSRESNKYFKKLLFNHLKLE